MSFCKRRVVTFTIKTLFPLLTRTRLYFFSLLDLDLLLLVGLGLLLLLGIGLLFLVANDAIIS
jgi:hypothetical protein